MSHLVVKSHRPWQLALAIIFLSMFFAVLTWLLLDRIHWSVIHDRIKSSEEYKLLWEVNKNLEEENKHLRERVLTLEQTTSLDKRTAALLQDEMTKQQDQLHRLKGELEFYQGIMESTRDAQGLNIYGIHVTPLTADRTYLLKVVLTHVAKGDKVAEGTLDVTIEGRLKDGKTPRKYDLKDLSIDNSLNMTFRFKNFKQFVSNLTLPPGFDPLRVMVQIHPRGSNQATISKVFEWRKDTS
jgi:uncharacterized protein YdiU (UPF0061 family)